MVQPQCAALSAEPALQTIHGDNDWMQSRGLQCNIQGLITLGWIIGWIIDGQAEAAGSLDRELEGLSVTKRCPLYGLKADTVANQGSVRESLKSILGNGVVYLSVLQPNLKGPERRYKRSLWLDVEHRPRW